uniref:hexokinase n=1 Tax=Gouania willdenowi TaxID=441366 RepID=A0A8C5GCC5_GOUWI
VLCSSSPKIEGIEPSIRQSLSVNPSLYWWRLMKQSSLDYKIKARNKNEHGDFLALDLGGTNFRVLHVRVLEEEKVVDILGSQTCSISQDIMLGTGEQLFDHIAACLADFISSQNLKGQTLPLGFTFSFSCEQKKIDESILLRWTKGFNCSGVEGRDIVQLLKEAVQRRGDFTIGFVAMVNDTVGTMMSCGYRDQSCEIGLIIGTGTNACYMEEMRNVKRVEGEDGRMCINTEWGGFGDDGTLENIITDINRTIDQTSIKPGVHIFEKMISGMYLGELVRLLLVKLTEQKLLFKGQRSTTLLTAGTFPTKFISEIEEPLSGLENAKRILSSLNVPYDSVDARIVRLVCDTVSSRTARLCAAALATIANRIRVNRGLKHLKTTVAPGMVRLLAPDCDITFILSQDGSGKGAAMVTAVAQRLALQSHLVLQPFCLSVHQLRTISDLLMKDLIKGLGKHSHHKAAVKMLPTFVRSTPDGTEHGDFLALDLGGTNFRVLHVRVLEEEKVVDILGSQTCSISQDIMLGTGEQLFDHIAACLADFISSQNLKEQTLPLGFTFSFPCEQKKIDESILIRWTKGFNCSGVEGRDIVQLLKEAVQRRGDFTIGSVAMVNDTVGTMMSCGYRDQSCEIGLIIGTGTNACYMEEMRNVKRVEGEDGRMCINTEWGGFGDDGTLENIITDIDRTIDQTSIKPGVHIFEKMISGMYLGELVRLLLVKLTEQKLLFKGQRSTTLLTAGTFPTKFISEIEEPLSGLENAKRILSSLNVPYDFVDARIVRLVCDTVSSRSARLCAAALATVANRIRVNRGLKHLKTTVGVDGTVYKKHPNFSDELQAMVRLLAPDCDVTFILSQDGSGKGAAMVTAVAQRLALQSHLLEDSDGDSEEED